MGVKYQANTAISMLDFNFSNFFLGTTKTATSSKFELQYGNGYRDVFQGHGFNYANNGVPSGGTVEEFSEFKRSKELFEIDGLSLSAKAIVKVARTDGTADDAALIVKALSGNDTINGSGGNDVLYGAGGNDKINGKGGNDTILSGPGADKMTGGSGSDFFVFLDTSHSPASPLTRDVITDFTHSDNLYLGNLGGGQFIGTSAFSGQAGDVRFDIEGSNTIVYGDYNGDTLADFSVRLNGVIALTAADFTF